MKYWISRQEGSMETIVIVDDENDILELVKDILETANYRVLTANNGKEALEILEQRVPDLVILDMMMPGMSGREIAEWIRKNPKTKDVKIIFLTVANFSETGKDMLKKLKVGDYITKPFENEDLLRRIKQVLDAR